MQMMGRIACLIAMSLTAAAQQPELVGKNFLLSRGRAGPIEIGESVDDVYKAVGKDNARLIDTFQEGLFTPALEIRLPSAPVSPSLLTRVSDRACGWFTVTDIEVDDPRFRTAEGFGIGSRVGLLRRAYDVAVSHEEGEKLSVRALGMLFMTNADASNDRSAVTSVILVADSATIRAQRCPGP